MGRVALIVLDSVGCGGAPDAAAFGDDGADTLGHIARACARGQANGAARHGALRLPHLDALGLGRACAFSTGRRPDGLLGALRRDAIVGCAVASGPGKDTPSGHWAIAGAPPAAPFFLFPKIIPAFPAPLIDSLVARAGLPGVLGLRHGAGVAMLDAFGVQHRATGAPILYTSVDSVLQIAAHEETFGLARLYETCAIARDIADAWAVGRVIARPFVGDAPGAFRRTAHRKDYALAPPCGHLLDRAAEAGRTVVTIGKIGDIFAHRATGHERKTTDNADGVAAIATALATAPDGALVFANLVDFDSDYGHRRDVAGYAAALEAFDRRLPEIEAHLADGDLLLITADHGNDPTFRGTDHTRENIPIVGLAKGRTGRMVGRRDAFADIGQTVARHLGLAPVAQGRAF